MRHVRYAIAGWHKILPIFLLLCLPLLLFSPVVFGNATLLPADNLYSFEPYKSLNTDAPSITPHNPLLSDLILENYPWKQFLVSAFNNRELPLWDPYIFAGHPFLANGQHSALYPLTWIFFVFEKVAHGSIPRAFGIFITLQLGLAGLAMYCLSRVLKTNRLGAFVAGIIFQFSGFMVISVVHPMVIAAASWLPLLLALIELTVRRVRFFNQPRTILPWALLGAIILGLQILAGHAEITYFTLLVMGMFSFWRLVYSAITQPRETWRDEVVLPALGLLLLAGLGLALGAVQLWPLYEVVQSSFRQNAVTLSDVLSWAYPKRRIITFLIPNFFGNPVHRSTYNFFLKETVKATYNAYGDAISAFNWGIKNYVEGAAYIGILPLLLAIIAVFKPLIKLTQMPNNPTNKRLGAIVRQWLQQPTIPFFTGLTLFSLACMFGTPIYALVYALPFLNQSHAPFRWVYPLTVALAALAGMGVNFVMDFRYAHGPDSESAHNRAAPQHLFMRVLMFDTAPNWVSIIAVSTLWSGILLLCGLWLSRLFFAPLEPLVEHAFWSLALAPNAFPDHHTFYAYLFPRIQLAALLLMVAGIVLRVSRCPIYLPRRLGRRPVWEALAISIILLDLVSFGLGFNPAVEPALLEQTPPVVDFLKQDTSHWRFTTFDPHGRNTMAMNTGMFYNLQDVRGYDSLFTAQYARYMNWIEPQGGLPYNRIMPFTQFPSLDSPLTDMLNVKYILTEEEIPLPKYDLVYQDIAMRVYENLGVMPRTFTLPENSTLVVPNVEAVGQTILEYDPRFYTIIEEDTAGWTLSSKRTLDAPLHAEPGVAQAQSITAYTANEISISATVNGPSWLILADSYYPGWKAFIRPLGADDVEETEVSIARVAGNFRGIRLDESSAVRFKYSPNSVKIGAFVSFISGMSIIFFAVLWVWRRTYRETADASTIQRVAKNSIAPILLTLFNRMIELAFAMLRLRLLGPASEGTYYYAVSAAIWFEILINFGLDAYLTREIARHKEQANRYFFNTTLIRLGLSLIGIPLVVGFILIRQTLIAGPLGPAPREAMWALVLLYIGISISSVSKGITSLFYAFEKAEYPAAITSITTLLKVTLGTLILMAGGRIIGLAGASIVINLVTLSILSYLSLRLFFKPRWEPLRDLQREMLAESWPLMVNHFLATVFVKIDVFLLEAFRGSLALGMYSVGYKFFDMLGIIPSMFTLALFPVIARQSKEAPTEFMRFYRLGLKILLSIALPTAILATLTAREMVLILGGPEYLPGAMIAVRFMSWSMVFGWMNSLTQYVLIALDEQRYLTRAYLFGFSFTVIANLLLIPKFGYRASAILHIFSELALFIPFAIGVQRNLGHVNWWGVLYKPTLAALIMGMTALLLQFVGHWPAVIGAIVVYPLSAWQLGLFDDDELTLLSPLLRRNKA